MGGIEISQIILISIGQTPEVLLQLIPQLVQRTGVLISLPGYAVERVSNSLKQLRIQNGCAQIEIYQ